MDRIEKKFRKVASKLLPPGTRRRHTAIRLLKKRPRAVLAPLSYQRWIEQCEPRIFSPQDANTLPYGPQISIVVPCYNTPEKYIQPLVDSIIGQTYNNWQLCLVDGSTDLAKATLIEEVAKVDDRIDYKRLAKNEGIVGNTNQGLKMAHGEFIGFLDHDDLLAPKALAVVVLALNEDRGLDLIYSDEDKLSDNGKERLPWFFKPEWSPEMLLGVNYITHFTVARKKIINEIKGLRSGFDGAQDYDFLLRFTEKTQKIKRIPKILYHWRMAEGSTAKDVGQKSYADNAGQRALRDAVKGRGIKADVIEIKERPTNYRLRYRLTAKKPLVSIIVPFKDKADLLKQCVGSILTSSTYTNFELILLSNRSTETATHEYLETLKNNEKCRVFYWDHPFNYSAINNFGAKQAKGEYLILLNNDTEVITNDWIEELIGVASQPNIGAVGPLLRYPDTTIQHAGIVLGMGGMAGHPFRFRQPEEWTSYGLALWPRNFLAVTGACLAIKKDRYFEVGGLDEEFIVAGNDVAFGISLYEKGYRNVYWPFASLIHYENVSVGSYSKAPITDYNHSLTYYRKYLNWQDPYFNSNLDLMNEQLNLRNIYD